MLVAAASAGTAYLAISLWVIGRRPGQVRASHLAEAPVADLIGTQRHYVGAVITVVAAVVALGCAVLLMRSAGSERSGADRYARRADKRPEPAGEISERAIWDALDAGSDPTQDPTKPDNKGR